MIMKIGILRLEIEILIEDSRLGFQLIEDWDQTDQKKENQDLKSPIKNENSNQRLERLGFTESTISTSALLFY